jgi:hypothetical protein
MVIADRINWVNLGAFAPDLSNAEWFSSFVDDNGAVINTFVDRDEAIAYMRVSEEGVIRWFKDEL